jgi:hypothetical protein
MQPLPPRYLATPEAAPLAGFASPRFCAARLKRVLWWVCTQDFLLCLVWVANKKFQLALEGPTRCAFFAR